MPRAHLWVDVASSLMYLLHFPREGREGGREREREREDKWAVSYFMDHSLPHSHTCSIVPRPHLILTSSLSYSPIIHDTVLLISYYIVWQLAVTVVRVLT